MMRNLSGETRGSKFVVIEDINDLDELRSDVKSMLWAKSIFHFFYKNNESRTQRFYKLVRLSTLVST